MTKELSKRLITSLFLIIILALTFLYPYILIISLIIISLISWIEFYGLIFKIFTKNKLRTKFLKVLIKTISLLYLILFSVIIFKGIFQFEPNFKLNMLYLFCVCICSDVGGLIFGKTFKGRKLTKISPNKTISGCIGSFVLSLILVPIFYYFLPEKTISPFELIIISIIVSFICQLGDLFISLLKRKAKVKDTGDLLPGHGGLLDRIDGILFAVPVGVLLWGLIPMII